MNQQQIETELIHKNLSAIFVLLITFQKKIEQLKQKLCSFIQFSPQRAFSFLDYSQKGYISPQDIVRSFDRKININRQYIHKLIQKANPQGYGSEKLSYFGFLNLVKPYFNQTLARDILSRDSAYSHAKQHNERSGQKRPMASFTNNRYSEQSISAYQQLVLDVGKKDQIEGIVDKSVKALVYQLITIYCIFTTEHQQAKEGFLDHHLASAYEISQIIQKDSINGGTKSEHNQLRLSSLSKVLAFIQNHSQYDVQQSQVKFLLAFCQCHQYVLLSQRYLTKMFMPINISYAHILKNLQQEQYKPRNERNNVQNFNTKKIEASRNWNTLRPQDNPEKGNFQVLNDGRNANTGFLKNFLHYSHPNSIPSIYTTQMQNQRKRKQAQNARNNISQRSNLYDKLGIGKNYVQPNPPVQKKDNQASNRNSGRENYAIRIEEAQHAHRNSPNQQNMVNNEIQLPVLQRFMKQSNIPRNMTHTNKMYQNKSRNYDPTDQIVFDINNFNKKRQNYQESFRDQSSAFIQDYQPKIMQSRKNNIVYNTRNNDSRESSAFLQVSQHKQIPINYIGRSGQKHELSLINEHPQLKNILKDKLVINHSQYLNIRERDNVASNPNQRIQNSRGNQRLKVGSNYKHELLHNRGHLMVNAKQQQLHEDFYQGYVRNTEHDSLSKSKVIPSISRKAKSPPNKGQKLQVPVNKYYEVNNQLQPKSRRLNTIKQDQQTVLQEFMMKI